MAVLRGDSSDPKFPAVQGQQTGKEGTGVSGVALGLGVFGQSAGPNGFSGYKAKARGGRGSRARASAPSVSTPRPRLVLPRCGPSAPVMGTACSAAHRTSACSARARGPKDSRASMAKALADRASPRQAWDRSELTRRRRPVPPRFAPSARATDMAFSAARRMSACSA